MGSIIIGQPDRAARPEAQSGNSNGDIRNRFYYHFLLLFSSTIFNRKNCVSKNCVAQGRARPRKGQSKNCVEFPRKVFCARPRKVCCINYYHCFYYSYFSFIPRKARARPAQDCARSQGIMLATMLVLVRLSWWWQETGDRRQETGDRRQETRDRRQETETGNKRQETVDGNQDDIIILW